VIGKHRVIIGGSGSASGGSIEDREGRSVAYFDPRGPLLQVKLRGPPVGPSVLQHGHAYAMNVFWPDSERQRWEAHQAGDIHHSVSGYTQEEREWLRKNYRSEFHFLRDFGLKIYKSEDREEGRKILRAFMRDEDEDGDGDGDED